MSLRADVVNQVEECLAAVERRQPGSYRVSHRRHTVAELLVPYSPAGWVLESYRHERCDVSRGVAENIQHSVPTVVVDHARAKADARHIPPARHHRHKNRLLFTIQPGGDLTDEAYLQSFDSFVDRAAEDQGLPPFSVRTFDPEPTTDGLSVQPLAWLVRLPTFAARTDDCKRERIEFNRGVFRYSRDHHRYPDLLNVTRVSGIGTRLVPSRHTDR